MKITSIILQDDQTFYNYHNLKHGFASKNKLENLIKTPYLERVTVNEVQYFYAQIIVVHTVWNYESNKFISIEAI